jgi:hypothetical protein
MMRRSCGLIVAVLALAALGLPAHAQTAGGASPLSAHVAPLTVSPAGTVQLQGVLSSTVDMTMTGAFSVGQVANLRWDLPAVQSTSISGYSEQVSKLSYGFSVSPDTSRDLMVNGAPIHRVTWDSPPADTIIRVTEHLKVNITSPLSSWRNSASYPLAAVSGDTARFLTPTSATQLPPTARKLVGKLARGKKTERAVVEAVMNWIASHTQYGTASSNHASAVFARHVATCVGYTNLGIAMLRMLNIPAQAVYGWASAAPIRIGTRYNSQTIQWGRPGTPGELHAWLNVYFPTIGWVPFDPQLEKFFVDPRHIAYLTSADASNIAMGQWSGTVLSNGSATGPNLSNGYTSVVPGAGDGGRVTVQTADSFQVKIASEVSDVRHVILYSR